MSAENVQLDLSKVKIEPLFEEFVDFDTFAKFDWSRSFDQVLTPKTYSQIKVNTR